MAGNAVNEKRIIRVLLVEDSESDAELLIRRLRRDGHEVRARRVQDAKAMTTALATGQWDVIVSDYRMPGFDAPEALEILQRTGQDIPFLVVSGTIGEEVAVAMMKAGAHDYLMKGNLTRLTAAVERELREAQTRAERRRAMHMLQESQAQLTLALEATEMGVFDYWPRTGKTFYSEMCKRHLQVPEGEEPTLEGFLDSVHPEERGPVLEAVQRAFRPGSGGHYAEEYRMAAPGPGGEPRWISAWGRVIHDEKGEAARFLGVVRDITEQKRAQREL
jgi:CheY-like chemotaxis protein